MPVYKFRTLEEAERALWLPTCDPRLAKKLRGLWKTSWIMAGSYVPPRGVFKFRSIEEANAHREAWEQERFEWLRAKRDKERSESSKAK
jgi:hypothetical protein